MHLLESMQKVTRVASTIMKRRKHGILNAKGLAILLRTMELNDTSIINTYLSRNGSKTKLYQKHKLIEEFDTKLAPDFRCNIIRLMPLVLKVISKALTRTLPNKH